VEALLKTMDAAAIERAVLLGWYWENHDTGVAQNRFFASCVRTYPDRLSAFAAVQPKAGEAALTELRRAREDGLIGVGELCPHAVGIAWDAAELADVFSLAGELGMPVNLHVTDPSSAPYPGRVETPLEDFERWAQRHRETTFVLAHWAGGLDVRALPNVWVDTAAAPLIYRGPAWNRLGTTVRPEQVLFGSDYPLNLYPKYTVDPELATFVGEAKAALADEATRAAVLGGNARRVFRLPLV